MSCEKRWMNRNGIINYHPDCYREKIIKSPTKDSKSLHLTFWSDDLRPSLRRD
jgi:hypothetical protein